MRAESQRTLPTDKCRVAPHMCPSCRCELVRERRRIVDRLYSLVKPIKRYRCQNFPCQWVGNFARTDDTRDMADQPDRVPVAFVVHMSLVVAMMVAVFVFSSIEPTIWTDDEESQLGISSDHDAPAERTVAKTGSR